MPRYGELDAQKAQDELETVYDGWRAENTRLLHAATETNQHAYIQMLWTLAIIAAMVVAAFLLIWIGLQRLLLTPLTDVIAHIRLITAGNLTHRTESRGCREMQYLAENLMRCNSP